MTCGSINCSAIQSSTTFENNAVRLAVASTNVHIQPRSDTSGIIGFSPYGNSSYSIKAITGTRQVVLEGTLEQTSSQTGTLVVTGGVGVGGDICLKAGADIVMNGNAQSLLVYDIACAHNTNIVGALTKGSGTFNIEHPNPSMRENGWRLQHSFVESPTYGDNLYRYKVNTIDKKATITLPDYFKYLNNNVQVWINAVNTFGLGKSKVFEDRVEIETTEDDEYNVLIIGTRKDEMVIKNYGNNFEPEIQPKQEEVD